MDNISSVSNGAEHKWTALPRPNTKHLTRQPVLRLTDLFGDDALDDTHPKSPCVQVGDWSPAEEDPFAKFDELCANVDLTVYSNSSSEEKFPVVNLACGLLKPSPIAGMAPDPCIYEGALCPVCGDLLVSKASLAEHMKKCIDNTELD